MSRLKWSLTETFLLHPFCTFSSWSQPPSEARITASGPWWKSVCIWVHWFCELGQYRIACLAPSFLYMVSNETLNFVPSRCPLPSYPNPKEEYLFCHMKWTYWNKSIMLFIQSYIQFYWLIIYRYHLVASDMVWHSRIQTKFSSFLVFFRHLKSSLFSACIPPFHHDQLRQRLLLQFSCRAVGS